MLKRKQELRYRKGNKSARCLYCSHFNADFKVIGIGGQDLGNSPRYSEIGLKPGRFYRVGSDHLCDAFADKF